MLKKSLIQFFSDEFTTPTINNIDESSLTNSIPESTTIQEENSINLVSETEQNAQSNTQTQTEEYQISQEATMAKTPKQPQESLLLENGGRGVVPTDPTLLALYEECFACKSCELCDSAINLVFGDGSPNAKIMLIGEAPGADEDEQGRPFVGRAGQLLVSILNKYGVQREDIFIANILKHRPPNNRNPLPAEIQACTPFLKKQIAIIQPQLLITLGNFSSQFILDTKIGITKIRGQIQDSSFGKVMPSLHPSAIIRGAYPKHLLEGDVVTALQFVGYDVQLKEDE